MQQLHTPPRVKAQVHRQKAESKRIGDEKLKQKWKEKRRQKKEADAKAARTLLKSVDNWREEKRLEMQRFTAEQGIRGFDEDIIEELGNVRRPLVLVRGEPITIEQTMELITGEEPLFGEGAEEEETEVPCYFDP